MRYQELLSERLIDNPVESVVHRCIRSFRMSPWAINNGWCWGFAVRLKKMLGDGAEIVNTTNVPGAFPGHSAVLYRGRYYDAESPEGVVELKDLAYCRRLRAEADQAVITEGAVPPGLALFKEFGGKVYTYRTLPKPGRNAVKAYFIDEHGADVPADSRWGYVELPMERLKAAIGGGSEDRFPDFETYHRWYLAQGNMPDHARASHAVILDDEYEDVLYDGWHRFHDYARKGVEVVGAVLMSGDVNFD